MSTASKLGVCQWFHYEAYQDVERAVDELRALGVKHLRTGVSWADYHRPKGRQWYDWQMAKLAEFDVLLSVWHTPPSIAEGGVCAGPPQDLAEYGAFIGQLIDQYDDQFAALELWNEPNNRLKWDFKRYDPQWEKFARMISLAADTAHRRGKRTVLGGMIPVDPAWLQLMRGYGALEHIDVVAIHGFPGMWWADAPNWDWFHHWHGWEHKIKSIAREAEGRPIWITETGLATWDRRSLQCAFYEDQTSRLQQAVSAPTDRVYWYSLIDLDPSRAAIEGFHVDEHEYHLGLVSYDGRRKPAWHAAQQLLQKRTPLQPVRTLS